MVKGKSVPFSQLRELADAGDSLAAVRLAGRLELEDATRLAPDAVHYYGRAAYAGRDYALRPMIRILKKDGERLSQRQRDQAELVLQTWAARGLPLATDALTSFYRAGKPFGHKPDQLVEMLRKAAASGDGKAALDVAVSLLSGPPSPQARDEAREYLEIAGASPSPGLRAMAEALLRRVEVVQTNAESTQ